MPIISVKMSEDGAGKVYLTIKHEDLAMGNALFASAIAWTARVQTASVATLLGVRHRVGYHAAVR